MDTEQLEIAYQKLKEKQESLEPYMPVRLMAETLGTGNSIAQIVIEHLLKQGRIQRFKFGKSVRYRIL